MAHSRSRTFRSAALRTLILAAAFVCAPLASSFAQGSDAASQPAMPGAERRLWLGVYGSAALPVTMGEFSLLCDDCVFSSGSGMGVEGGLLATYPLDERWSVTARIGWGMSQTTYEKEASALRYVTSGQQVMVSYMRKAVIDLSAVSAYFAARWSSGIGALYVVAGPRVNYNHASNAKETERIVTPDMVYFESGTNLVTLYDGAIGGAVDFQKLGLGLRAGVGYDFAFGPDLIIAPEVGFALPLLGLSPKHKTWKIGGLDFVLMAAMRM
ncbi:MAG: outer membrane beta-barrel protein [Ignavibacteria bacterium]|nr:outer membrane beta-barrel protein [Ignavibacteria bacterium]